MAPRSISLLDRTTARVFELDAAGDAAGEGTINGSENEYYTFTAHRSGRYTFGAFAARGSEIDTVLGVFGPTGRRIASNDDLDFPNDSDSLIEVNLRAGKRYYFGVTNFTERPNGDYTYVVDGPIRDDDYEANNSRRAAFNLGMVAAPQIVDQLVMADAHDWYRFQTLDAGREIDQVAIFFAHDQGDLDLELYSSRGRLLDASRGVGDAEAISLTGLPAGVYYVRVIGIQNAENPRYDLYLEAPEPPFTGDDLFEENDSILVAFDLGTQVRPITVAAFMNQDGEDWYRFALRTRGSDEHGVLLSFVHAEADLDLVLYDARGRAIDVSDALADEEYLTLNRLPPGVYYLQVILDGDRLVDDPIYNLTITPPNGRIV